uniref:Uncharacterized protein n=1 Tax=Arundo donax TaxID=35708 RepID=A0A0A9AB68_ARUDO
MKPCLSGKSDHTVATCVAARAHPLLQVWEF